MAANLQTTFWNACFWIIMFEFHLKYHLDWTKGPFDNKPADDGLTPNRRQAII